MPRQFVDLPGAATLATRQFRLVEAGATGVIHGPAGTGKSYAVEAALERLREPDADLGGTESGGSGSGGGRAPVVASCTLTFPSRPTMRLIADELVRALTGSTAHLPHQHRVSRRA